VSVARDKKPGPIAPAFFIPYIQFFRKGIRPVKRSMPFLVLILTLVAASVVAEDASKVIAVVNGTEITSDQRPGRAGEDFSADYESLSREQKSQLVLALINRQLVLEAARAEGFDQTEKMQEATRALVDTYLVEQYMLHVATGLDFSEGALRDKYSTMYADMPEQFHVAHILVGNEESALVVLEKLGSGGSFASLAQAESKDPVSAEKGGDLGWLTPDEMVPAFFNAVSTLSEGEVYSKAVRTQFGWHLLRLLDRRDATPPPFEAVIPQLKQSLMREGMAAYLESLRSGAAITVMP
jgi:peptidyl-prolyl cis-trans isomerase C